MKEIKGNIFDITDADAICVTTNGIVKSNGELVMGAGIAKQFAKKWPDLPIALGDYVTKNGNVPGVVVRTMHNKRQYIVSYPTKNHWKDSSDINLIRSSALSLKHLADQFQWEKVILSRPGCGLGALKWEDVKAVISSILDDRFFVITPENSK